MVKLQVWIELTLEYSRQGHLSLVVIWKKYFNYSLATSYVPKFWKMKMVSLIRKGDVKTDPSNFRCISIIYTNENF